MPRSTLKDTITDRGASRSGWDGMRQDRTKIIVVRWGQMQMSKHDWGGMTEDKDKRHCYK